MFLAPIAEGDHHLQLVLGLVLILAPSFAAAEFGRNVMYLGSAFFFALFIIPVACAQNLETIIVARFLMGVAGSTGSTMVGGTIADVRLSSTLGGAFIDLRVSSQIWRTHERGLPMSIFAAAALAGIAIGAMSNGEIDFPLSRLLESAADLHVVL